MFCEVQRPQDCPKLDCGGGICYFIAFTDSYKLEGDIKFPCGEFGCQGQTPESRKKAKEATTKSILED
jgi:hypothetical protein